MKTPISLFAPRVLPRIAALVAAGLALAGMLPAKDSNAPATASPADTVGLGGSPTKVATQITLGTYTVLGDATSFAPPILFSNVEPGTHVTVSVNVDVSVIAEINWYKDDAAVGVTTPTLDIASASTADSGLYSANIRTTSGSSLYVGATILRVEKGAGRRLLNLSTRAAISASQPFFISGLVVSPSKFKHDTKGVLIRVIGSSLGGFGVANPLADPKLEVYDSAGNAVFPTVVSTLAVDLTSAQVGAFPIPHGSGDVAAVFFLTEGIYSARVSSLSGGSGNVLLEVYDVPN